MSLHFYFLITTYMDKKFLEIFADTSVWILDIAKKWNDIGIVKNDGMLYDYQLLCSIIERKVVHHFDDEVPLTFKEYYV